MLTLLACLLDDDVAFIASLHTCLPLTCSSFLRRHDLQRDEI